MWILIPLLIAGQADDILADEAKGKSKASPPAATAPAELPPAALPPAPGTEVPAGGAPAGKAPAATASAESAPAAEAPVEGNKASEEKGFLYDLMHSGAMGYMIEGGPEYMTPILILGILALGVIIERFRALMMLNTRNEALRREVRLLLEADRVEEALKLCDREQGPVPAILGAGLRKYLIARRLGYDAAKIEEQVTKGMDDYSIHIVAAMEKHLPILATVSSAAPMLGFLGTVAGMVFSFDEIVRTMGEKNIVEAAAAGIKVSLLTTVFGLIVGIPSFIAFNYFNSVVNRFVLDVQESAADLIEAVTFQLALMGKAQEAAQAQATQTQASEPTREPVSR